MTRGPAIRLAVGVARFDRSIKATTKAIPFPSDVDGEGTLANNRKYRESRHFAEGEARAVRRPVVQTVSAEDADYEKCIPGKFQPATLDTRDPGVHASPDNFLDADLSHLATHSATNFGQQLDI